MYSIKQPLDFVHFCFDNHQWTDLHRRREIENSLLANNKTSNLVVR